MFVQAVGKDLQKRLLRHLIAAPALAIDENEQQFSDTILLAIEKEDELKTVTNIAERAAFWDKEERHLEADLTSNEEHEHSSLAQDREVTTTKVCGMNKLIQLTNLWMLIPTSVEKYPTIQDRSKYLKY